MTAEHTLLYTNFGQKGIQINEQIEKISPRQTTIKTNPCPNNKIKEEIDYFIANMDNEVNRVASAETTWKTQ